MKKTTAELALEALKKCIEELGEEHDGVDFESECTACHTSRQAREAIAALDADLAQAVEPLARADALGFALLEHLGPAALTGGTMSVHDAFVLGWNAAPQAAPVNAELLEAVEILDNMIASVARCGPYSKESTLLFLSQARLCLNSFPSPQEAAAPEPVNEMLLAELQNIANANPKNWDAPYNDSASFQAWAQSRARAAIEKVGGAT